MLVFLAGISLMMSCVLIHVHLVIHKLQCILFNNTDESILSSGKILWDLLLYKQNVVNNNLTVWIGCWCFKLYLLKCLLLADYFLAWLVARDRMCVTWTFFSCHFGFFWHQVHIEIFLEWRWIMVSDGLNYSTLQLAVRKVLMNKRKKC